MICETCGRAFMNEDNADIHIQIWNHVIILDQ